MQILHSAADSLTQGWPLLITVIGSLRPQHTEAVVKTAFQALQLVLTDFLPLAPHNCLPLVILQPLIGQYLPLIGQYLPLIGQYSRLCTRRPSLARRPKI